MSVSNSSGAQLILSILTPPGDSFIDTYPIHFEHHCATSIFDVSFALKVLYRYLTTNPPGDPVHPIRSNFHKIFPLPRIGDLDKKKYLVPSDLTVGQFYFLIRFDSSLLKKNS